MEEYINNLKQNLFSIIVDNLISLKDTSYRYIKSPHSDEIFKIIDKYVDEEIVSGNIIKKSQYDFRCEGWVNKVNTELIARNVKNIKLEAITNLDSRLIMKIKGQGCYFIIHVDDKPRLSGCFTWSIDPIMLHTMEMSD